MNKTLMFLGVASMLAATPVLAASASHTPKLPAKHAATMCLVHGKKQACRTHVAHKVMKKHHVIAMVKKPVKAY